MLKVPNYKKISNEFLNSIAIFCLYSFRLILKNIKRIIIIKKK